MLEILLAATSLFISPQDPTTCELAVVAPDMYGAACEAEIEAEERAQALGGYNEDGNWDPMYNATVDRNLNIVPRAVRRPEGRVFPPCSPIMPDWMDCQGRERRPLEMDAADLSMSPEEFLRARGFEAPTEGTPSMPLLPTQASWGAVAFSMTGFGVAEGAKSQAEAEETALVDCRRNSKADCAAGDVIAIEEACLAVASGATQFGFALGTERRTTGQDAVADCESRDEDCRVAYSGCNFSSGGR